MNQLDYSILLPVYNEKKAINEVLTKIQKVLEGHVQYEILVVDDGSTDGTTDLLTQRDNIEVVRHPYNIGNGAAIKTGIRNARGKSIIMMDADGQHNPSDLTRIIKYLGQYDMVVGARTSKSETSLHRNVANRVYNLFASYITSVKIEDLTSGMRGIKTEVAKQFIDLLPNTFSYPTTLTMATLRAGYSLKYIPIETKRRIGTSKIRILEDGVRFLLIIFKVATLYSPLRIFIPISLLVFFVGFAYYLFKYITFGVLSSGTVIIIVTSVMIFLMGLISEQISQLQFRK